MSSKYIDTTSIMQVIGCVFNNPEILSITDKYSIVDEDFSDAFHKTIFGAIYKIYELGANKITFLFSFSPTKFIMSTSTPLIPALVSYSNGLKPASVYTTSFSLSSHDVNKNIEIIVNKTTNIFFISLFPFCCPWKIKKSLGDISPKDVINVVPP